MIQANPDENGLVRYTQRISDPNFTSVPVAGSVAFRTTDVYLIGFRRNDTPIPIEQGARRPEWLVGQLVERVEFGIAEGESAARLHLYLDFDHAFEDIEPLEVDDVEEWDIRIWAEVYDLAAERQVRTKNCDYTLTVRRVEEEEE